MEEAIKRSIEGGLQEGEKWKFVRANKYRAVWLNGNGDETTIAIEKYLLDPLFWQALGKAMEWDKTTGHYRGFQTSWEVKWHRFIDALAKGKSPDEYFSNLLKVK